VEAYHSAAELVKKARELLEDEQRVEAPVDSSDDLKV
jgi:hypothetical protein